MKIKTKSKFFGLINNKYKVLDEEVAYQDPTAQMSMPPARPGEEVVTSRETETIQEPEPEVKQMTPEGEVELIRLIRKALVLEPTEGSIPPEILDDEINEENGREVLSKMKAFMNTFSDDPDIDY
jgi:hypothetical protein